MSEHLGYDAIRPDAVRRLPGADFDSLDLATTDTLPVGVAGAARQGGGRNRQQPRRPIRAD